MQLLTSAEIKVISLEMFRLQNFDVVLSEVRYFFSFVGEFLAVPLHQYLGSNWAVQPHTQGLHAHGCILL